MRFRRNVPNAVAAFFALVFGVVAVPLLLATIAGSPIPHSAPGTDLLSSQLTDDQVFTVLASACWLVWIAFIFSVVTELVSWMRGTDAITLPLVGGLTRRLVLTAALLFTSTQKPVVPLAQQLSPITAISAVHVDQPITTTNIANQSSATIPYTVQPRDDLWSLAERHLSDPYRWKELFEMNKGTEQHNGQSLTSPDLLRPGWVLQFPADATGLVTPTTDEAAIPEPTIGGPATVSQESPVGAPNAQPSSPSLDASNETVETHEHPTPSASEQNELPLARLGLLATGTVIALDQARRRRRRHRKTGTVQANVNEAMRKAEVLLRVADVSSKAQRLNLACRALAHCFSTSSNAASVRIEAVRVSEDEIEFLLDHPVDATTGPFRVESGGHSWVLDSSVHDVRIGALAAEMSAPLPALVNVGSLDNADTLVDLEAFGVTSITGDKRDAVAFAILEQLATNVWSDHIEILTVGVAAHSRSSRMRQFESIEAIPQLAIGLARGLKDALAESACATTFQGRSTQNVNDGWIPTVLVVSTAHAHGPNFSELVSIADAGGHGLSIVVVGECADAQRTILANLDWTTVTPPNIELASLPLDATAVETITELFDQAARCDEIEYSLTEMPVDLREIVDLPAPPTVSVNVLGQIEITGGEETIERSRSVEAVVYLTLHPNGATDDKLKTALWPGKPPTPGTFNTTISLARRQLGGDAEKKPYVLPVTKGRYRVSEAVGSDLDRFEQLFAMAKSTTNTQAIRLLSGALELVRGRPFDETRSSYSWAHVEGFVARAEAIVADAAHMLAQMHLREGDAAAATWAARKGLLASPGYEVLYRDLMLACEIDGNLGALETIMAELNALLDVVDPDDNLESETTALYDRLRSRRSTVSSK